MCELHTWQTSPPSNQSGRDGKTNRDETTLQTRATQHKPKISPPKIIHTMENQDQDSDSFCSQDFAIRNMFEDASLNDPKTKGTESTGKPGNWLSTHLTNTRRKAWPSLEKKSKL